MLFHYWPNLKPPGAISEYRGLQYTGQCSYFCVSQNKYEVNSQQCVNCMLAVLRYILKSCCFVSCAFIGIYNITLSVFAKNLMENKKKLIMASDYTVLLQILTKGNRRRNKYSIPNGLWNCFLGLTVILAYVSFNYCFGCFVVPAAITTAFAKAVYLAVIVKELRSCQLWSL